MNPDVNTGFMLDEEGDLDDPYGFDDNVNIYDLSEDEDDSDDDEEEDDDE